ncbi:unnamed protein product [Rotaria sordida]|uniref:Uncharacterized protein n=1 Tax=Rotaria sordida TaxID=392033 RepID=A0A820E1Y1_9BILA|nr:unnamed protein product [Rotaria sordida]
MINCYGLNGVGIQAIELYHEMPSELINEATHICVLNACSHSRLVDEARSIFKNIQNKTEKVHGAMSRIFFFEEEDQELIDEYERYHSPVSFVYGEYLSIN